MNLHDDAIEPQAGRSGSGPVPLQEPARLYLAGYHFADLRELDALRDTLREAGRAAPGLRGTVLLTPEGINLFVCGTPSVAESFLDAVRAVPALAGLRVHRSRAAMVGFNRFLVKIKRETITFRHSEIRPADARAPTVSPADLARWLDAGHDDDGRPLSLLDTRNAFEVAVGSFQGAIDPGISSFTDLPAAVQRLKGELTGRRVVTFCTGGIRCEKAALWMQNDGVENVVQLDGGVLGYFDAVGARHWSGELFVFDRRVALKPDLEPAGWRTDFATREVLRQE